MRAFVAVTIDDALRQAFHLLQRELRPVAPDVRWVRPEVMHLTLKFAGEVADGNTAQASRTVGRCAAEALPFRATFRGVGAFPTPHRPSVLWVGVSDEPAVMADLHRRLDEGLAEIGVERESKGFHSHLTLGRVNRPRPLPALAKRAPAYEDHVFGSIEVREIMLMRSELTPSGPIYTPVSRHALGKTA